MIIPFDRLFKKQKKLKKGVKRMGRDALKIFAVTLAVIAISELDYNTQVSHSATITPSPSQLFVGQKVSEGKPASVPIATPNKDNASFQFELLPALSKLPTLAPSPTPKITPSPAATDRTITGTLHVTATAYEPEVNTPSKITACGTYVHDGTLAVSDDLAPLLPCGTKVVILDPRFKGKIFAVEDRMASYWSKRIDIWMPHYDQAIEWGKQPVRIKVVQLVQE